MKSGLRFLALFVFWSLSVFCFFNASAQSVTQPKITAWPSRYSATYGFDLTTDLNGVIIVSSVDTTSQAYRLGVHPGMELMGWNTLPIRKQLELINIRKYRKTFPVMTDQNIRLMLLTRGKPGETAQAFFITETGNNRGIRITAQQSFPGPAASAR